MYIDVSRLFFVYGDVGGVGILEKEGKAIGGLFDTFRGRFAGAVSGIGLDAYKYRGVSGLGILHLSRKLERMSRNHTVVVVGGRDKSGRILHAFFDVV